MKPRTIDSRDVESLVEAIENLLYFMRPEWLPPAQEKVRAALAPFQDSEDEAA